MNHARPKKGLRRGEADVFSLREMLDSWYLSKEEPLYVEYLAKLEELEPLHDEACETLQNAAASKNVALLRETLSSWSFKKDDKVYRDAAKEEAAMAEEYDAKAAALKEAVAVRTNGALWKLLEDWPFSQA